ncbi:NAD(P)H-dependent FMN reductase LOT6 [Elsinoe australis]|uniref:NAD(P)H-dependent FMN reductase LOT6 n=1 Tax=Elsinoe australis TaxID=40998 RepID=A0A4U7AQE1_9PEZI|nr:NAD(P)H-dependent FMN reductase LOT6 [Elsinoe australis]
MSSAKDTTSQAQRIGVMVCSTRKPRACPQIANFVINTIEATVNGTENDLKPTLHLIDLNNWNLPMFNESGVPSQIRDPAQYDHDHTRAWSTEISSYDAFIFVTPQYNWGYPAVLKNAVDYLFNEWKGKPALIVTYGGHGGDKCGGQLRQVLMGLDMVCTSHNVELTFPGRQTTIKAARGHDLQLDGTTEDGLWGGAERERITELYEELLGLLSAKV